MSTKKIGVIVGREWSWPPAYIDEVNRRHVGVTAQFVKIGGTAMAELCEYDLIIDRISHEIPYYRTYLKNAMLSGTMVINNPFWWSADDKFFGACLATKLGVLHPRTIALPSHSYVEGVVEESLRNLRYPIPWHEHVEAVGGFPVILKPAWGGGFKQVYKVHSYEELWHAYNETGTECMMLQEYIDWDKYVRCVCIGKTNIMTIKFDANAPWPHRYFRDDNYLTEQEGREVVDGATKLNMALGYDMNTVEFALKDGKPYAIDFTNPAPDFDVNSLTPHYFDWIVQTMADFTIAKVQEGTRQDADHRWSTLINLPADLPSAALNTIPAAAVPAAEDSTARPARKGRAKKAEGDALIDINGIGPTFEKRLNAAGLTTFAHIAEATADQLRAIVGDSKLANIEDWITEAQQLVAAGG